MHNPITAKVLIQDLFDACKNAGYLPSVAVSAFHFRSFRKTVRLLYLTRVPVSNEVRKWGRFNSSVFVIEKLWCGLLDYATAYADGRLTFTFKNGSTFEG